MESAILLCVSRDAIFTRYSYKFILSTSHIKGRLLSCDFQEICRSVF